MLIQLFDAANDHFIIRFIAIQFFIFMKQIIPHFPQILLHHLCIIEQNDNECIVNREFIVETDSLRIEILSFDIFLQQIIHYKVHVIIDQIIIQITQ